MSPFTVQRMLEAVCVVSSPVPTACIRRLTASVLPEVDFESHPIFWNGVISKMTSSVMEEAQSSALPSSSEQTKRMTESIAASRSVSPPAFGMMKLCWVGVLEQWLWSRLVLLLLS